MKKIAVSVCLCLLVSGALAKQAASEKPNIEIVVGYETEETGFVKLTRGQGVLMHVVEGAPFDTVHIVVLQDGTAHFTEVDTGAYIVSAFTDQVVDQLESATDSTVFLPTYFPQSFRWKEADTLHVASDISDTLMMTTGRVSTEFSNNESSIFLSLQSDYVNNRSYEKGRYTYLFRFDTLMMQEELTYFRHAISEEFGEQRFYDIPDGYYYIEPQIPGIPVDLDSYVIFRKSDACERLELSAIAFLDAIQVESVGWLRDPCTLGVSEYTVQVFPNPVTDQVIIQTDRFPLQYVLFSIEGRSYGKGTLSATVNVIDTSSLEEGLYFIHEENSGKTHKFIVKRD